MPITYDSQKRIFKLDTKTSTYALLVYRENYLVHLYYGAKLPDDNLASLMYRGRFDSLSPYNPKVEDELFSPDINPLEYSTNGAGDFRISACSVRGENGDTVTDLRYVSHRILPGKPKLPGLPATFAGEDEAQTLELETVDSVTGVRAFLLYTVFEEYGVITRSVRFENRGSAPVELERAYSACVDFPGMDFDMVHLYGRWAKENSTARHPLQHGIQSIQSKRGMTGPNHNPFVALARNGCTEETGEAYGFNLIYSGNFAIDIETDTRGCSRLLMGINPTDFRWKLSPEESFTTPEAVLVYSDAGMGGMSRTFHKFYLNHLMRSEWAKKKRPLLINSWEAAYFDFDDDKLAAFAGEAQKLGIEMLVMDDGWFGNRCDDHRALGDWAVNEQKLKGGLQSLIQRVNALGVKFGIWYEPEMINPDSDLYRAHPDWAVCARGRDKSISRYQCVLDMTREDVRDNIFRQMYDVISKNNIEYIKWDCNRHISEAASLQLPPDRQGEFFHRYVLGVYDLMDRITTAFPHILLENCSSGGGRFDAGMLYYSPPDLGQRQYGRHRAPDHPVRRVAVLPHRLPGRPCLGQPPHQPENQGQRGHVRHLRLRAGPRKAHRRRAGAGTAAGGGLPQILRPHPVWGFLPPDLPHRQPLLLRMGICQRGQNRGPHHAGGHAPAGARLPHPVPAGP